ncbi:polysaccharide deacetylase family protein [Verticiella sediminum]|uniref:Polysaccharide deacetylase family protein n=1 Tax=Verticiella sediminum TaxID=1247510 RepID=A0A556AZ08_9BURK|nr:polysaccharide deacetylase family protein [Verticiella sediminum]TSH98158.1 polysaccharide deacetylase family protein [Verticiella sediminum]
MRVASFRTVPVLMYHHVSPSNDMLTTVPERFESQLAWLAEEGYATLDAEGLAGFLAGRPVPDRSVVLTFDDGFLDNWVYAHPLLQRYGMRAVLFVITGQLGEGAPRACAGSAGTLPDTPGHRACEAAVAAGRADEVMLRWSEVEAMREAGTFDVHSHTHTHTRWDQCCPDAATKRAGIAEDIGLARESLQRRLGPASAHLCWPQGYFDDDYVAEATAQGYTHLYTTDPVGQNVPGADPRHIRRITAKDEPAAWLRRRLWLARHRVLGPLYDKVRY